MGRIQVRASSARRPDQSRDTRMERFPMKRAVVVLLVAFGVFWLVTDPHGLAQSAQKAGASGAELTGDLFNAVIDFVREIE